MSSTDKRILLVNTFLVSGSLSKEIRTLSSPSSPLVIPFVGSFFSKNFSIIFSSGVCANVDRSLDF